MVTSDSQVRHVVAGLRPVQLVTCAALWLVFAVAWLAPSLDLPLREIVPFGLAAAVCRTLALLSAGGVVGGRRVWPGLALSADALLLTGLLDITGGPFNPFIVMFVTYVWLAWSTLSPVWAVVVLIVSASGFGWLVVDHLQAGLAEHHRLNDFPTHLFTMWFAGASIMALVSHYVGRARAAIERQQREIDRARERAANSERLAALMTLAAGAAHELATPLATIAVAANELERNAANAVQSPSLTDDARLIKTAVHRCQEILDGMSARAPGGIASTEPMTADAIAAIAAGMLSTEQERRLQRVIAPGAGAPVASGAELARALASLLKNAFDASAAEGVVSLRVSRQSSTLRFEVQDRGHGLTDQVRHRIGEPFFTTKRQGEGLGLGVFLARAIAEQAGGTLHFESGDGTTAIIEVPAA